MRLHRIKALVIRHLYLYQRSLPRLLDLFFWPILSLLLWGFLSAYLQKASLGGLNMISILLGAVIFWDLLSQSQRAISISFLEDIWEKNLLNVFVTPLKVSEFLASTVVLGFIRIALVGILTSVTAFLLYHFNILSFGFFLVLFLANLLLFGWAMGIFTVGIILRFGTAAQALAFGLIAIIQPFSAVFYPVSALPPVLQWLAWALPPAHIFEGMRAVIQTGFLSMKQLLLATVLNLFYLSLAGWFFSRMFASVKKRGGMMKLD